jgi:hypothetical protein
MNSDKKKKIRQPNAQLSIGIWTLDIVWTLDIGHFTPLTGI